MCFTGILFFVLFCFCRYITRSVRLLFGAVNVRCLLSLRTHDRRQSESAQKHENNIADAAAANSQKALFSQKRSLFIYFAKKKLRRKPAGRMGMGPCVRHPTMRRKRNNHRSSSHFRQTEIYSVIKHKQRTSSKTKNKKDYYHSSSNNKSDTSQKQHHHHHRNARRPHRSTIPNSRAASAQYTFPRPLIDFPLFSSFFINSCCTTEGIDGHLFISK